MVYLFVSHRPTLGAKSLIVCYPFWHGFATAVLLGTLWCTWLGIGSAELAYPPGIRPGMQVSGSEGEYFRYKQVLIKPPDDADRMESLRMAEDIKCLACELLLRALLERAESLSEDHIMDQLDGELVGLVEITDNEQVNRVNKNRRGCNKHFKDDLLLKGWAVRKCPPATSSTEAPDGPTWCLERQPRPVAERDVDTYSKHNDAVFYACESTIGRSGQELASFLAEGIGEGDPLPVVVAAACREAARCEARKPRQRASGRRKRTARRRRRKTKLRDDDL